MVPNLPRGGVVITLGEGHGRRLVRNVVVLSMTLMAAASTPGIHADERDCIAFEYDQWETLGFAWLYVKNRCSYRVHAVVEAFENKRDAYELSSWTLMVSPRERMRINYSYGAPLPIKGPPDAEASVYIACRAFRKAGEYYGIDPDDYSRCLTPENVP